MYYILLRYEQEAESVTGGGSTLQYSRSPAQPADSVAFVFPPSLQPPSPPSSRPTTPIAATTLQPQCLPKAQN
ncbi:hypothetical protein E2C01_043411 [Portunus trituberculatus]|uniref:Uncharacterized protein n=1 Tax=Portunus trituberculatus TaxID=210409 RepID=A0A5B7FX94_PORTR|nr:hypothetical protein [Portunus trituberculatus]